MKRAFIHIPYSHKPTFQVLPLDSDVCLLLDTPPFRPAAVARLTLKGSSHGECGPVSLRRCHHVTFQPVRAKPLDEDKAGGATL